MSFSLVRSKGRIIGDGQVMSAKRLRDAIPAGVLLALQIDAALTGKVRQIDTETGEDVGPARPIEPETQLELMERLLKKRLPDAKSADVEADRAVDLDELPTDPEEVKRLPISQLGKLIEAQFTPREPKGEPHAEPAQPEAAPGRSGVASPGPDGDGRVIDPGHEDHPGGSG